jgi:pimeloyl-ACP methyl ester carboxylesterase
MSFADNIQPQQVLEVKMRRKKNWLIPILALLLILAVVYLFPVKRVPFEEVYAGVDPELVASLQDFRENNPPQTIDVGGVSWEYVALGQGEEAILFLHGMTGAQDIWWQQINALKDDFRLIAVTYPALENLAEMSAGIQAILAHEGLSQVNLVGSSLGGYLAQYLVANQPQMVKRAVFANTFPPNDRIAEQNATIGALLPYLPEWLVMAVLRSSFQESIYPASQNNELVLAYLMEISYGRMNKSQVHGRFLCVVDPFNAPDVDELSIPVMILEASNDPLVEEALREQLKDTYPSAKVVTMGAVGHFPYLNQAQTYSALLHEFFTGGD